MRQVEDDFPKAQPLGAEPASSAALDPIAQFFVAQSLAQPASGLPCAVDKDSSRDHFAVFLARRASKNLDPQKAIQATREAVKICWACCRSM